MKASSSFAPLFPLLPSRSPGPSPSHWASRRTSLLIVRYRAVEPACLVPQLYGAAFAVKVLLEWLTPRYRALRVLRSTLTAPAAPKTGTYEARSVSAMPDKDLVSGACCLPACFILATLFSSLAFWVRSGGRAPCCREPVSRRLEPDHHRERRCIAQIRLRRAVARHAQPLTRRIEAFAISRPTPFVSGFVRGVSPRVIRARQHAHRCGLFSALGGSGRIPTRNRLSQNRLLRGNAMLTKCAARPPLP